MDLNLGQLDFVLRNGTPAMAAVVTVLAVVVRLARDLPGLRQAIRRMLGRRGEPEAPAWLGEGDSTTVERPQRERPESPATPAPEPFPARSAPEPFPVRPAPEPFPATAVLPPIGAPAPLKATVPLAASAPAPGSARGVLLVFGGVVLTLGMVSVVFYWPSLVQNGGLILYAIWLFVTMIAGMFVQVIVDNYRAGETLFSASGSQLALPLLFSIIVYYPIWAFAASSPQGLFAVYTAFMNGYFWQHIVAAAKPPQGTAGAVTGKGHRVR